MIVSGCKASNSKQSVTQLGYQNNVPIVTITGTDFISILSRFHEINLLNYNCKNLLLGLYTFNELTATSLVPCLHYSQNNNQHSN